MVVKCCCSGGGSGVAVCDVESDTGLIAMMLATDFGHELVVIGGDGGTEYRVQVQIRLLARHSHIYTTII